MRRSVQHLAAAAALPALAAAVTLSVTLVAAPAAVAQQAPKADEGREPRPPRAAPRERPAEPALPGARSAPPVPADKADKRAAKTPAKKKPAAIETPEDRAKALANLYAHLATAADGAEASKVAAAIEGLWAGSAGDTAALLISRATQAMVQKQTDLAQQLFDAAVDLAPDYADGFARRAYFHFTESQTTRALGDLRRALALDPNHYRALDGMAKVLREIGEKKAALEALKQLELVHPQWPGLADDLKELEREVEGQGI